MLVVEVLAPLGEADGGEAVLVEGGVIAAAEEAVAAELEHGIEARSRRRDRVGTADVGNRARELAGGRIALIAKCQDAPNLLGRGVGGDIFGEDADSMRVLTLVPGCTIAADDVVVEDGFELPAFLLREVGEVFAAEQVLFFAGDGDKDQRGGEFDFGEDAGALQADRGAAGVVVGAGRFAVGVLVGAVTGIVVAGDEDHARGLRGIAAAQDGVNVVQGRGLGHARIGAGQRRLHEGVTMDFQTAVARGGDGFKLRLDPVGGGQHAGVGREIFVETGERAAIVERDKGGNRMLNLSGRDLSDGVGDRRIGRHRPDRSADGIQIAAGGIG